VFRNRHTLEALRGYDIGYDKRGYCPSSRPGRNRARMPARRVRAAGW